MDEKRLEELKKQYYIDKDKYGTKNIIVYINNIKCDFRLINAWEVYIDVPRIVLSSKTYDELYDKFKHIAPIVKRDMYYGERIAIDFGSPEEEITMCVFTIILGHVMMLRC